MTKASPFTSAIPFSPTPHPVLKGAEISLVALLWILFYLFIGAPFPIHYDSVNFAYAIADKFTIAHQQPQPPGFLFHVLSARMVAAFIGDAFRAQQAVNCLYLIMFLATAAFVKNYRPGRILLLGSTPLLLFFCGASLSQCAAIPFGGLIAMVINRPNRFSPYWATLILFIGSGFRQDMLILLGPVVLVTMLLGRYPFRTWLLCGIIASTSIAAWYIPTQLLSERVSPLAMTVEAQHQFSAGTSLFFGASLFTALRSAIRFLMYGIGAAGFGGLLYFAACLRKAKPDRQLLLFVMGIAPTLLYGTLIHMPLPYYYAPALGFALLFCYRAWGEAIGPKLIAVALTLNLLLFFLAPPPQFVIDSTASERGLSKNIHRQLSYIGANGNKELQRTYALFRFADTTVARRPCFSANVNLSYDRAWEYLANRRWHNRYRETACDSCCRIVKESDDSMPKIEFYR
jgi:hypothetical protein